MKSGHSGHSSKVQKDEEEILEVLRKGGELTTQEVLRVRIRYMSDGMALGSKEFVEEVFEKFRDQFPSKRKTGARRIRRAPLGELNTLRDLQTDVVG